MILGNYQKKEEKSIFKFDEKLRPNPNLAKISNYFLQDHKNIDILLKDLVKAANNQDHKEEILRKVRWAVEKHFYMEEKLFLFADNLAPFIDAKLTRSFIAQHNQLLKAFQSIEKCKDLKNCAKYHKLRKLLGAHIKFETKNIYPLLSTNLNSDQQAIIHENFSKAASLGFFPLESLRKYYQKQKKSKARPKNIGKIM